MEKMTFSERLNLAMKESGFTQGALAEAVGMAQPSVWKLVSGGAKGSKKTVQIAKVRGVRPEWLADGIEPMKDDGVVPHDPRSTIPPEKEWGRVDAWDSNTPLPDDEVEVPFLKDIELAAGDGSYCNEDYNGYKIRFSKSTLRRVGAQAENVVCFPARGKSMEPVIPDGTTVAIDCGNKKINDGDLYAISTDGMKRIKQLYRRPGGIIVIRSFNREEYRDEEVLEPNIEIIGRMFWSSTLW